MERTLFDDDHELFRDSVRGFIAKELAPHHEEWERAGVVDRDLFRKAGAQGFLGMAVPEDLGGGGVDDFRYNVVIAEEVQRADVGAAGLGWTLHNDIRSEEHTSELQSLMRNSYAVFCLKKKTKNERTIK